MAKDDNKKNKKSKKDAQLVLRLDREMRDRFKDACQDLDTSAAREVRKFIKQFIRDELSYRYTILPHTLVRDVESLIKREGLDGSDPP